MHARRVAAEPTSPGGVARLTIHGPGDPDRGHVERFIRKAYARQYDAHVAEFSPVLVARRLGDEIVAAAGYRRASDALFLEQYLDHPIEWYLDEGGKVARESIVEVGHLSASLHGEGRRLMAGIAAHLSTLGIEWVATTVTLELRRLMYRLGLGATCLAKASPDRLRPAATSWGSYYDHQPLVMMGHLPTCLPRLRRALQEDSR